MFRNHIYINKCLGSINIVSTVWSMILKYSYLTVLPRINLDNVPWQMEKTPLSWRIFLWKQGGQPWTNKKMPPPKKCQLNSAPINPIKTNMYSRLSILHLTEAVAQQTAKLRPSPWRCKAARDTSGVSGRWATGPAVTRWRTGAMKGWKQMWVCLKMVSTPLYPMVLLIIIPIKWL